MSQTRDRIEDTGRCVIRFLPGDQVLLSDATIWAKNDHYAGYVIEIEGVGYEFIRSLRQEEISCTSTST
jgi:hypothetical protein